MPKGLPLLMDRAYEGNETRQLMLDLRLIPVVPPKSNRSHAWDYDYCRLQEAQRDRPSLPPTQRSFRRIFSSFERLDVSFPEILPFAVIVEALRVV